jgi:sulfotransferase family protein
LPIFRFGGPFSEQRKSKKQELRHKRQELRKIRDKERATKEKAERREHRKRKKRIAQEIFQLERELRAAEEGRAEDEPRTGALPDFAIIGTMKGGTTYLYHLLSLHPLVEPAATKELHFFDALFDEGVEWYRRCFPKPKLKDGRNTITGEATPYMAAHHAPERMAEVIPQARLIALLRDPVDRAYSDYQMLARKERETHSFEEAITAKKPRRAGKGGRTSGPGEDVPRLDDRCKYLSRGVYVDQLVRWSRFFPKEQMLVLKSEDFFEDPQRTLKAAFEFLGLPNWEFEASEIVPKRRNKGSYEDQMNPATRRRLKGYFEPHNQRLYDFLGVDFGW